VKIYTKTGDGGETGLWGGLRVGKDAARVHAYGTVDECNAAIGVARAALGAVPAPRQAREPLGDIDELLAHIQNQLFVVGADLATPGAVASIPRVGPGEITFLEQAIDALEGELEPLRQFILPGGTLAAAHLHLARTICRRAERALVTLAREESLGQHIGAYLNRLSDCLFVLARAANARAGVPDVPWNSPRG
jgi:cob(I)alamin adenosyltransferase